MRSYLTAHRKASSGLILGCAAVLGLAASLGASPGDGRYVQVQSTLGQMYDTVIDAADLETFGLSIPRGTALPRRMYPVRNFGVPMIQELNQPRYKDVLLRRPKGSHTEYLDPNPETNQVASPETPPVISAVAGGNNINRTFTVSWPASSPGWRVESISVLVGGGIFWTPVSPSLYQTNGATISYVEPLQSSGSKFFRLHKP